MITSYVTIDEALNMYPHANEYEPEQQQEALVNSFSLVNSFLPSNIPVPVIGEGGVIPGILKIFQVKFFQWILETSNMGFTSELDNLYNSTSNALSKLTDNELLISEASTTNSEIGWNIIDSNFLTGKVMVRGEAPELETEYLFTMTISGMHYTADTSWSVQRTDSATPLYTLAGQFDWQSVDDYLEVRFDGQFTGGETFRVKGVPSTPEIVSNKPIIKQSEVYY